MLKTILVVSFLLSIQIANAASSSKSAGQDAQVKSATAIVYDSISANPAAIAYLSKGEPVRISKKTYGKGKYFKVKLQSGKFGYISSFDVQTKVEKKAAKNSTKQFSDKEREKINKQRLKRALAEPMMYNKWFGLFVGKLNFREKIEGASGKESLLTYGLKITGPDVLIGGPIMDVNLLLHFGAPDYYNDISKTKPSGFLFFGDALMLIPFGLGENSGFYAGIGPMFKYTSFKWVSNSNVAQAKSAFNLGGAFSAGLAYRINAFSARVEGKYYVEKVTHTQIQFALQTLY